jgi:hypothetical protein
MRTIAIAQVKFFVMPSTNNTFCQVDKWKTQSFSYIFRSLFSPILLEKEYSLKVGVRARE